VRSWKALVDEQTRADRQTDRPDVAVAARRKPATTPAAGKVGRPKATAAGKADRAEATPAGQTDRPEVKLEPGAAATPEKWAAAAAPAVVATPDARMSAVSADKRAAAGSTATIKPEADGQGADH
jgi:hypothetical protein